MRGRGLGNEKAGDDGVRGPGGQRAEHQQDEKDEVAREETETTAESGIETTKGVEESSKDVRKDCQDVLPNKREEEGSCPQDHKDDCGHATEGDRNRGLERVGDVKEQTHREVHIRKRAKRVQEADRVQVWLGGDKDSDGGEVLAVQQKVFEMRARKQETEDGGHSVRVPMLRDIARQR